MDFDSGDLLLVVFLTLFAPAPVAIAVFVCITVLVMWRMWLKHREKMQHTDE